MMNTKTFAGGAIVAGLLLTGWGVVAQDADPIEPSALGVVEPERSLDGIRPIEDVVSFWQMRVDNSNVSFLDRTQLGVALARQARQTASLVLYEESEAVLRKSLAINPDYLATKLALGQAVHSLHRFSESLAIAEQVLLAEPTSDGALALLGDANLELGNYAIAERRYDELVNRKRTAPALSRSSRFAYLVGQPEQALALAEEALQLSQQIGLQGQDAAFYWFQLGHVRFQVGDIDGSVTALERALDLAPGAPGTTEQLAFVYASIGRTTDAERLYRQLLATGPAADLHGRYADLLEARGDTKGAAEQERLGLALATKTLDRFPAERRHLSGFFMTRDPKLAVELAEADLAERHDVGAYDTLAWALYHDGRLDEASTAIASALAIGTKDAAIYAHAGAIAAANGEDVMARQLLSAALAINPKFHPTEAAAAKDLLASL